MNKELKKHMSFLMTGGLMVAPLSGIEPPVEAQPIPPQLKPTEVAPAGPGAAKPAVPGNGEVRPMPVAPVQRPYLGVMLGEVPPVLSAHLDLEEGVGMVVRELVPGGPAETAGVERHDVITRFNGQPFSDSMELRELVEANAVGDEIEIDLVHGGEEKKLSFELGVAPELQALRHPRRRAMPLDGMFQQMPQGQAERIREAIEQNLRAFDAMEGDLQFHMGPGQDLLKRMEARLHGEMKGLDFDFEASSSFRLLDDEGSIEMKGRDGGREVRIFDKEGNLLWEGPYDTDQDKAAVPEDLRQRLESLDFDMDFDKGGMRLHLGPKRFRPFNEVDPEEKVEER